MRRQESDGPRKGVRRWIVGLLLGGLVWLGPPDDGRQARAVPITPAGSADEALALIPPDAIGFVRVRWRAVGQSAPMRVLQQELRDGSAWDGDLKSDIGLPAAAVEHATLVLLA